MAAKTHLRSEMTTRLAGEIYNTVHQMREVQENLIRLSDILAQIGLDGNLAEKLGFIEADDAEAVKTLLASAKDEILSDPFYQQVVSRMG